MFSLGDFDDARSLAFQKTDQLLTAQLEREVLGLAEELIEAAEAYMSALEERGVDSIQAGVAAASVVTYQSIGRKVL